MDRRRFIESCTLGAACACMAQPVFATGAKPRTYSKVLLVDERGEPIKASRLKAETNYIFHYPYESTPVFLLDLGREAAPQSLSTRDREAYTWPGGVGARRGIVAYSAICPHQLNYPTRERSSIGYRKTRAQRGVQDQLIHCCEDHCQYDPARGAEVLSGPAVQPLCAVLLAHEPRADTLTAYATLGGELFDEFFRKHEKKLSADTGPRARAITTGTVAVSELDKFSRVRAQC